MKRIYLDYASTTPLDKRVFKAMKPYFEKEFANPSSLYQEGVIARKAVEKSRKEIAGLLKALPEQITFTSSGTEANNMAILGTFNFFQEKIQEKMKRPHFITSTIEHPSVLEPMRAIEKKGAEVTYISPSKDGLINPLEIKKAIKENTVLVSVMYANNEIGTINPIKEIAKMVRKARQYKENNIEGKVKLPYFHTDASQAANYLDVNVAALNVDLMTLDASKIYGPKGIGFLFKRSHIALEPILYGGSQEKSRRPGTENVASIVGLSESLKIAEEIKEAESIRLLKLRNYFITQTLKLPRCILNGSIDHRLPNNINLCIEGMDAEYAVFLFDAEGIALSSVTSCRNLTEESSSYVIEAIKGKACAASSLRITLGRQTEKKELEKVLRLLPKIIDKARKND